MTADTPLGLHINLCATASSLRFVVWFEQITDSEEFLRFKALKRDLPIRHPYALRHTDAPVEITRDLTPVECLARLPRLGSYYPIALPRLILGWNIARLRSSSRSINESLFRVPAWVVPLGLSLRPLRSMLRDWIGRHGIGAASPNVPIVLELLDDLCRVFADSTLLPTVVIPSMDSLVPSTPPRMIPMDARLRPAWTASMGLEELFRVQASLKTAKFLAAYQLGEIDRSLDSDEIPESWVDESLPSRLGIFFIELFDAAAARAGAVPDLPRKALREAALTAENAAIHVDHGSCLYIQSPLFQPLTAPRAHLHGRLSPLDAPDELGHTWEFELGALDSDQSFLPLKQVLAEAKERQMLVADGDGGVWVAPGLMFARDWPQVTPEYSAVGPAAKQLLAPELLAGGTMRMHDADAQEMLGGGSLLGSAAAYREWLLALGLEGRSRQYTAFSTAPTSRGAARVRVRWELADGEEPSLHGSLFVPQLELAIGDATMLALDVENLLKSSTATFVRIEGRVVAREELVAALHLLRAREKVFKRLGEVKGVSWSRAIELDDEWSSEKHSAATESLFGKRWTDFLARLQDGVGVPLLEAPEGFQGTLRPYQLRGLSWMAFLTEKGFGGCLADDMGLGKTVQVLSLLALRREGKGAKSKVKRPPELVVCPTAVVHNWAREAKKFTPRLRVCVHQGTERARDEASFREAFDGADLMITSFALLRRDASLFESMRWGLVVIDEAQNLKNPDALQTRATKRLLSESKLCLSGTPVENHLRDLWSIFDVSLPGLLGGARRFSKVFLSNIRSGDDKGMERLSRRVGPFMLRRKKSDPGIAADLPAKQEQDAWCELMPEQVALYKAMTEATLEGIVGKDGISRRAHILTALMRFKQICNHPECFQRENPSALFGRSGKLERTMEILEELFAEGQRVVIFTQYREMGEILRRAIAERFGAEVDFYHGGLNPNEREETLSAFREDDGPPALIVSLKAGGSGLNLVSASAVIHYDRWWNPAVEDQATDRTHRIGQTRMVNVYKFVTRHTLEERIVNLLDSKRELASKVLSSSDETWITEMDNQQLKDFLTLGQLSEEP